MNVTEKNFEAVVKFGGMALAVSVVLNLYLVMRNREVYRDQVRTELGYQQAVVKAQALEGVIREFAARAATDANIAEILRREPAIGGGASQSAGARP